MGVDGVTAALTSSSVAEGGKEVVPGGTHPWSYYTVDARKLAREALPGLPLYEDLTG